MEQECTKEASIGSVFLLCDCAEYCFQLLFLVDGECAESDVARFFIVLVDSLGGV